MCSIVDALRAATACSFRCRIEPRSSVNRCAEDREGEGARNRRLWLTDSTAKVRIRRGTGPFPTRDFVSLAASQTGEIEGNERGEVGLL
jgi:hypothetical protein